MALVPFRDFFVSIMIGGLVFGFLTRTPSQTDWQPISTAPRDGTWIELKNSYGLMPTYTLSKWAPWREGGNCDWLIFGKPRMSVSDGAHLAWRPFTGDPANYVDPTGGAQDREDYWDAATAASADISIDQLHAIREKNRAEQREFGDGRDAPTWPARTWNGHFTLRRGVWCDDAYAVPSNAVLDQVRRDYQSVKVKTDSEGR